MMPNILQRIIVTHVSMIRASFEVGICGGGIGGMALALALQKHGLRSRVFERDLGVDARAQGYGLTIQQGRLTLRALGIVDAVKTRSQSSSSHFIFDQRGCPVFFWGGPATKADHTDWDANRNCHIARQSLRRILYEQLDQKLVTIHWNSVVQSISEADSRLLLHSQRGEQHAVSCAIGSDGIFSSVRKLLCLPNELRYAGVFVMLGIVSRAAFPLLADRMVQFSDGSTRLFIMPFDATCVMWQMSYPMDEGAALNFDRHNRASQPEHAYASLHSAAIAQCRQFPQLVRELLQTTPPTSITGYPVYDRDPLTAQSLRPDTNQRTWSSRVSVLGDAAFPMTPFKGQGANRALLDAVALAARLNAAVDSYAEDDIDTLNRRVSEALRAHEAGMCARSAPKVAGSRLAVSQTHCADFVDTEAQFRRRGMANDVINRERRLRIQALREHVETHGPIVDPTVLDQLSFHSPIPGIGTPTC
jgi:2-polyprenyl-6-methoxyphenol hydroxylase-like FAD-dependent oxidoreductase